MCGIAGVIAWKQQYRVDRDVITAMGQAIAHRGPDGQEIWLSPPGEAAQCALAFSRLAILDLDRRAMQPMTDGKCWLVFNGEIYNFRELRQELDPLFPEHTWKTTSDSEVILLAYRAWGERCVEKFNGMFAFAIWDPQNSSVFLARDRMGQKPLYIVAMPGRAVAFASELAALRRVPWLDLRIDADSVGEYLQTGYIASPATIYRHVAKLPPACWMRLSGDGSAELQNYFDPNAAAPMQDLKNSVRRAVQRQLVSDVPVGCFLSGGIDSSVIAAAMKASAATDQRVLTFSIGFDDPRYDETEYAQAVAAHLGTEHRCFKVHADAAEDLPKLARVFGEPFGDSSALPTHYLSRETRQHVKVALSGDGGDELFGGYDRYRAMRFGVGGKLLRSIAHKAAAALPAGHPKSSMSRARRFLAGLALSPEKRYASYVALFDHHSIRSLYPRFSERQRHLVAQTYHRLCRGRGRDPAGAAAATDRVTYLPEDLLTKLDRASMLHALEVRSPFLDPELVAMAAGLTAAQMFGGGAKRMLREAFAADLPSFVFIRRKMGFAIPIGQWLRNSLRPMLEDLLSAKSSFASENFHRDVWQKMIGDHCALRVDHSQRLYALLMLELWWRDQSAY